MPTHIYRCPPVHTNVVIPSATLYTDILYYANEEGQMYG